MDETGYIYDGEGNRIVNANLGLIHADHWSWGAHIERDRHGANEAKVAAVTRHPWGHIPQVSAKLDPVGMEKE